MASEIPKDKIERQHMKRTIILLAAFALFIVATNIAQWDEDG